MDEQRYEDALALFARMEKVRGVPAYATLGHFGRAVTLALMNKAKEANEAFRELAPRGKARLVEGRGRYGSVLLLLSGSQAWRYYLDKAKIHISRNEVAPADTISTLMNQTTIRKR